MKRLVFLNRKRCKGCYYCIVSCPKGVLTIEKKFNPDGFYPAKIQHPELCTGCAICANMCPEVAITVFAKSNK